MLTLQTSQITARSEIFLDFKSCFGLSCLHSFSLVRGATFRTELTPKPEKHKLQNTT